MLKALKPAPSAVNLADECRRIVAKAADLCREEQELNAGLVQPPEFDERRSAERIGREKAAAARGEPGADPALVEAEEAGRLADHEAAVAAYDERKAAADKRRPAIRRELAALFAELHPMKREYRRQVITAIMEMRSAAGKKWTVGPLKGVADVQATYIDLNTCDWLLVNVLGETSVGRFIVSEPLKIPSHVTFVVKTADQPAPDSIAAKAQALVDEYRAALGEFA